MEEKKVLYGTLKTEYVPLSSGDEIDVQIFETSKEDLKAAGFSSADEFLNYVAKQHGRGIIVAYDRKYGKDITAYQFNRNDGYNYDLRVGSSVYHTLQTW